MSTIMLFKFREPPPPEGTMIHPELARLLAKRLFHQDGTKPASRVGFSADWSPKSYCYLEGLADAGVSGAEALLKEAKRRDLVIWIEET